MILDKRGRYYRVTRWGDAFRVSEILSGREIAFAAVRGPSVAAVVVYDPQDRRCGVTSALYAYIERKCGLKLRPSRIRLRAGKAFWQSRPLQKQNTPQA